MVPFRCAFLPFEASVLLLVADYLGDACLMMDVWVLSRTSIVEKGYGTLKMVVWYFEEGGMVL